MTRMRRGLPLVAAACTTVAIAACGSSSTGGGSSTPKSGKVNPHAPEQKSVTAIEYQGLTGVQPFAAQPFFKQYGLNVKVNWETDGGVGLTELISGHIDILQSAAQRIADAVKQGQKLSIIDPNYYSSSADASLATLKSSGITSVKQLAGKKVGLTSVVGLFANRLKYSLKQAGVNPNAVTLVAVPYGEAATALQQHQVAATAVTGVSQQQAQSVGGQVMYSFGAPPWKGLIENVWVATDKFIQQNPNTVAAFQCAILKGGVQANVRTNFVKYLQSGIGFPQSLADSTTSVPYATTPITSANMKLLSPDYVDTVAIGEDSGTFDFSKIVLPQPKSC